MAKAGKGILDGFRGSIAQTTGSKDKGKSVIRAKPRNSPKTQSINLIRAKRKFKSYMPYWDSIHNQKMKEFYTKLNPQATYLNNFISRFKTNNFASNQFYNIQLFDNLIDIGSYFNVNIGQLANSVRCELSVNVSNKPPWIMPNMKILYHRGITDKNYSNEFDTLLLDSDVNINISKDYPILLNVSYISQATIVDAEGNFLSFTRGMVVFREKF